MKQMQLVYTIYDNIYQLFDDIVHSDNIELLSYFSSTGDDYWVERKDRKYLLYYSFNNEGLKIIFKCIVSNGGVIEEQHLESIEKHSLTEIIKGGSKQ